MPQRGISEEIYIYITYIYIYYMVLYEKLLVVLTHVVELMLFFSRGAWEAVVFVIFAEVLRGLPGYYIP